MTNALRTYTLDGVTRVTTINGNTYQFRDGETQYGDATFWRECPEHGREQYTFQFTSGNMGFGLYGFDCCTKCGQKAKLVKITLRHNIKGNPRGCNGACLNGKVSCDCKCRGRCHGAGVCSC